MPWNSTGGTLRGPTGPQGPTGATGATGATGPFAPGVVDARSYGAIGDDTTNDTTALQAALNATPAGGVCRLSSGRYRTSAPLIVPPNVTLAGSHGDTLSYTDALPNPCAIRALPSFTGRAVLRLLDKTTGGYAAAAVGTRIETLTVDGSACPTGGVAGVEAFGFVREATFDRVTVRGVTGDGFATTGHSSYSGDSRPPQSLRFLGCVAAPARGGPGRGGGAGGGPPPPAPAPGSSDLALRTARGSTATPRAATTSGSTWPVARTGCSSGAGPSGARSRTT